MQRDSVEGAFEIDRWQVRRQELFPYKENISQWLVPDIAISMLFSHIRSCPRTTTVILVIVVVLLPPNRWGHTRNSYRNINSEIAVELHAYNSRAILLKYSIHDPTIARIYVNAEKVKLLRNFVLLEDRNSFFWSYILVCDIIVSFAHEVRSRVEEKTSPPLLFT